jgi:hypothetical protein
MIKFITNTINEITLVAIAILHNNKFANKNENLPFWEGIKG